MNTVSFQNPIAENYKAIPVECLSLPVRVRNALRRNGIHDLFSLIVRYYGEGLSSCVQIGTCAKREIGAFLKHIDPAIVRALLSSMLEAAPETEEAPASREEGPWPLGIDPELCEKIPVEELGLPLRIRNVLKRNGIQDLYVLVTRYYGEGLSSCFNIGEGTVAEISLFLRRINKDIVEAFFPGGAKQEEQGFTGTPEPLTLLPELCNAIPVETLDLSVRIRNALRRNGIHDLRSLDVRYHDDGLASCAAIGKRMRQEIGRFLHGLTPDSLKALLAKRKGS